MAKSTILGTAISPRDWPVNDATDDTDYFDKAAVIGGHVSLITEWIDELPTASISAMKAEADARGLGFILQISPISQAPPRDQPAIPVAFVNSFGDSLARQAYKDFVMARAALSPTKLALAVEANMLKANGTEWPPFVTLMDQTYDLVKASYPSLDVFISFQYDVMHAAVDYSAMPALANAVDVFSLSSYPFEAQYMSGRALPDTHYSEHLGLMGLTNPRFAVSEIGYTSPPAGTKRLSTSLQNTLEARGRSEEPHAEVKQADFYRRLPVLFADVNPEWVSLALMHDISLFGTLLDYVGIRYNDGTAKLAYAVVDKLMF
jgi:hypothetical protein